MENMVATTGSSIWAGLTAGFSSFMSFVPALLGALLVLVIGWMVSSVFARLIGRAFQLLKVEPVLARSGVSNYMPTIEGKPVSVTDVIATLAKWFIRLIFVQAAANLLHMPQVTAIINSILLFIPNLLVSLLILVGSVAIARFVGSWVEGSLTKMGVSRPSVFALITRYAIIGFGVIAAVNQIGIATNLINILFTGLVGSLALAFGLAFGLGGQDVASELTKHWYDQGKSNRAQLKSVSSGK